MWAWVVPYESNSLKTPKAPDVVITQLCGIVQLRRHWLLAWLLDPAGQLIGDFRNNRFTLAQKRIGGANFYFPLVRVIVREAEEGAVLKIRSFAPMVYMSIAFGMFMVLISVRSHQLGSAAFSGILWVFGHAGCTMAYQWDKEKIEAKIREVL
jgi:hypothetical protein